MGTYRLLIGDCREMLRTLPEESVHCVVTSPPYWGLRDYGLPPTVWGGDPYCDHEWGPQENRFCVRCGAWRGQLGLEPTPELYVEHMVEVFREVRRVLRRDGTLWLNLGDSYAVGGMSNPSGKSTLGGGKDRGASNYQLSRRTEGLKPKDLVGIPWRVAFALQADGWYLRSDIIWCLSGGTWVYARTQKGEGPIMVRDLARLNPATVQLWNGRRWTQLLGMSKSPRRGDEIELVLRSGERISCTPTHRFPTNRGLLTASEIRVGDVLESCTLPEPEEPKQPEHIGLDAAWFAGLYIAEGSRSGDTIQIAGHANEHGRWHRIREIAEAYGGSAHRHIYGNTMHISVHGKLLNAIIDTLVSGRTAKDKCFSPVVWRYSNDFIAAMLRGYLEGDGHWDQVNGRWRIAFARNYNLERDLRTACARLGYRLTLKLSHATYKGRKVPTFRGEIREHTTGHHNERPRTEVVEIRRARCREVYDLGVADEPHLFALASGVLTHNSKPNPMPESVRDRPTKAHEYVFLLSKSERYYYDYEAIKEEARPGSRRFNGSPTYADGDRNDAGRRDQSGIQWRNRRSVWTVTTKPYSGAHFAAFPPELAERCILAGTSARGCCPECGAPWERVVERPAEPEGLRNRGGGAKYDFHVRQVGSGQKLQDWLNANPPRTIGWRPTCDCEPREPVPCTVLDPFAGSGTTGMVATGHGRKAVLIELHPDYAELARERIGPMLEVCDAA